MFSLEASANKLTDFTLLINITEHFNKMMDFLLSETFREEIEQMQKRKKCDEITFSIFSDGVETELSAKLWYFDEDGVVKTEDVLLKQFISNKEG